MLFQKLRQIDDWYQIYNDPELTGMCLANYNAIRNVFDDIKVIKDRESLLKDRIKQYLERMGNPEEYSLHELKEKYFLLDWIACNIIFDRPIKTKQLFITRKYSTQETLILNMLSRVLKTYFASARRNDFSGAHDYYDLWVFDEFHDPDSVVGATEQGTTFANTILKVLDGQETRLDLKYSRVFTKRNNVPIVMIANNIPASAEKPGPMQARLLRLPFTTSIKNIKEERVIATLWECIERRIKQSPYVLENQRNVSIQ